MDMTPPCEFPIPEFDGPTVAFGAGQKDYLTREQLGEWYGCYGHNSNTPFHNAVEGLFYDGGKLADYGLTFKKNVDQGKAMRALRGLMCSFSPKHEVKIGTCAVALANWCDYDAKTDTKKRT